MDGCEFIDDAMNDMPTVVLERDRFGGGASVMVWAGIAHGYSTTLVVIQGNLKARHYREDIRKKIF